MFNTIRFEQPSVGGYHYGLGSFMREMRFGGQHTRQLVQRAVERRRELRRQRGTVRDGRVITEQYSYPVQHRA